MSAQWTIPLQRGIRKRMAIPQRFLSKVQPRSAVSSELRERAIDYLVSASLI